LENEKIENEKIDITIWKNFLELVKNHKRDFIILSIIMVFVGALDSVFPLFTKYAIDNFIMKKSLFGLNKFIKLFLIIIAFQAINIFLFLSMGGKIETNVSYDIRKKGFEKLQILPLSYYDEKAVGWLMARMTSDINGISETLSWGMVDFAWGIAMMVAVMIAMFRLSVKLALISSPFGHIFCVFSK